MHWPGQVGGVPKRFCGRQIAEAERRSDGHHAAGGGAKPFGVRQGYGADKLLSALKRRALRALHWVTARRSVPWHLSESPRPEQVAHGSALGAARVPLCVEQLGAAFSVQAGLRRGEVRTASLLSHAKLYNSLESVSGGKFSE